LVITTVDLRLSGTGRKLTLSSAYARSDVEFRTNDNVPLSLGTGQDADIYYNATNLIIDPDVVGSGKVYIGATADDDIWFANARVSTTGKIEFNDSGTYWNSPSNGVLAGVTDGTITLGAAATNQMVVTSGGLTYFTGTAGLPFADMYVNGNAVETAIGGAGTYVQITVFTTNGEALDAVPDHTNDHITITKAGRYFVSWWVSVESIGAGAADHVSFEVRKNNGTVAFVNTEGRRKLAGGGGDTGSISGGGYIDLAANDTVELWGTNEDNATNFLATNVTLGLHMVAGT